MSRYADMEWLKDHIEVISYEGMWHETETDEFVSVENINSAPTIEIIRCKECKHWHKKDDLTYCDRIDYGYGYKADDFCSYGEREGD